MSDETNLTRLDDERAARFESQFDAGEIEPRQEMRFVEPGKPFMGLRPGDWRHQADKFGRPPHDPVLPLGFDGDTYYFLTARGTVSNFNDNRAISKSKVKGLYGGVTRYLWWAYPSRSLQKKLDPNTHQPIKDGNNTVMEWVYKRNFDAEEVVDVLINACAQKGAWNIVDSVRGRGTWRDDNGKLIVHLGDTVWHGDKEVTPGEYGDHIYPNRPPLTRPSERVPDRPPRGVAAGDGDPAHELLDLIKSWRFVRQELDPMLLLGWLLRAQIGGWSDYRPTVFITGDKAVGKSTIQHLVKHYFGPGLIQSADTTAAGIYQHAGHATLPVAIDELEAESDSRRVMAVVRLARLSATGDAMLRGGSDHNPIDFKAQSCFLFSSINMPPLKPQDRSRMAILELQQIDEADRGRPPDLGPVSLYGQQLLRRTIQDCDSGHLQEVDAYWRRLLIEECGYDGRGASTFGTLMASAWAALYDDLPTATEAAYWAEKLHIDKMIELAGNTDNWQNCFSVLCEKQPNALSKCTYASVGALIETVYDICAGKNHDWTFDQVNRWLHTLGLAIKWPKRAAKTWVNARLFVSAAHPGLNKLYEDTDWQGVGGADGVWTGALRQMPSAWWETSTQRAGGTPKHGLLLSLADIWGDMRDE
ncbi:MAG: hypothetical protein AAGF20_00800 [Pseudomonadota bacterium]